MSVWLHWGIGYLQDLDMYHVETDTPAVARTSNLNEELGQVSVNKYRYELFHTYNTFHIWLLNVF